jgi:acetyl esterase/lipase
LWIRPDGPAVSDGPVLLYLHGGAFEVCSPRAYQAFCSNLALRLDATVVVPDYRLAPEYPFPAAVEDSAAAFRDLLDAGHPASTLALMGDSAGGGLVLSCLIVAKREGLPQPAAAVALSAWADLTLAADSHRRCAETDPFIRTAMLQRAAHHYLAGWDPKDPLASPVHAAADELTGLAPVLLQAAANEVLADDSATAAERIAAAGGDVTLELCPEAFHVWQMAGAGVPESEEALGSLSRFVRERWS